MGLDQLVAANRAEAERPAEPAGHRQLSGEPAGIGSQVAMRGRPRDIQAGDRNRRPAPMRQQDPPVRRERPEFRSASGAIIKPVFARIERQPHVADPHRLIRAGQQQVDMRPLDPPVEDHLDRTIFGLPSDRFDVERLVAAPDARAGQPQLGRVKLEIGEVQHPVAASFEVGGEMRQAAGQAGKETVVEPSHPRLGLAHDMCMMIGAGDNVEVALHIDDADPRDQVPRQSARNDDVELAVDQVDHQRDFAVQLVAGQLEVVTAHQFVGDAEHPLQPHIGENRPRDIADAGHGTRLQPQWHAHWPWRRGAPPLGADVGEAGIVELYLRAGQPIRIIGVPEPAVERPHQPDIAPAHVAEQGLGIEQIDPHPDLAIGIAAKIDRAAGDRPDRR